jgi:uncharacterized PurR-regulated membrane protein YhhQ (DUF165 family)
MRRLNLPALAALAALVGAVLLANLFIARVGACVAPGGPCLIPVWPWPLLMAPSGVLWAGAALFARDTLHEAGGRRWVAAGVALGAALSWWLAAPALALASGVAFAVSEAADYAVYSPLRERSRPLAVLASGFVGSVVDSAVFLWLAFGSLDFLAGQVVGKALITALCAGLLWLALRRRPVPVEVAL